MPPQQVFRSSAIGSAFSENHDVSPAHQRVIITSLVVVSQTDQRARKVQIRTFLLAFEHEKYKTRRASLTNVSKVKVKFKAMHGKSTSVIPRLNVIA